MKFKTIAFSVIIMSILNSCGIEQEKKATTEGNLHPKEVFKISPQKDTFIITKNCVYISIPANSFESKEKEIIIEFTSAFEIKDFLKYGLTTKANSSILKTFGMINIQAKNLNGKNILLKPKKEIQISIPHFYSSTNNNPSLYYLKNNLWELDLESDSPKVYLSELGYSGTIYGSEKYDQHKFFRNETDYKDFNKILSQLNKQLPEELLFNILLEYSIEDTTNSKRHYFVSNLKCRECDSESNLSLAKYKIVLDKLILEYFYLPNFPKEIDFKQDLTFMITKGNNPFVIGKTNAPIDTNHLYFNHSIKKLGWLNIDEPLKVPVQDLMVKFPAEYLPIKSFVFSLNERVIPYSSCHFNYIEVEDIPINDKAYCVFTYYSDNVLKVGKVLLLTEKNNKTIEISESKIEIHPFSDLEKILDVIQRESIWKSKSMF